MRALQMELQVPPQLYSLVHPTAARIPKKPEPPEVFEGFAQQIREIKTFYVNVQKIKQQMGVIWMIKKKTMITLEFEGAFESVFPIPIDEPLFCLVNLTSFLVVDFIVKSDLHESVVI